MSYWSPAPGSQPTHRELQALGATLLLTRREAAAVLGVCRSTIDGYLGNLDIRLQVEHHHEAAAAMGWIHIPPEYLPPTHRVEPVDCGACGRPLERSQEPQTWVLRRVS